MAAGLLSSIAPINYRNYLRTDGIRPATFDLTVMMSQLQSRRKWRRWTALKHGGHLRRLPFHECLAKTGSDWEPMRSYNTFNISCRPRLHPC